MYNRQSTGFLEASDAESLGEQIVVDLPVAVFNFGIDGKGDQVKVEILFDSGGDVGVPVDGENQLEVVLEPGGLHLAVKNHRKLVQIFVGAMTVQKVEVEDDPAQILGAENIRNIFA